MADQYRWKKGRWELGPAALEDMRKMARSGALASDQNVSKDGGKTWACASEFSEIWEAQAADETLQSPDPASYQQFWDEELKIDGEPV